MTPPWKTIEIKSLLVTGLDVGFSESPRWSRYCNKPFSELDILQLSETLM